MSTPIGPYSPIVRAGNWLVCSGQLGLLPATEVDGEQVPPRLADGGVVPQLTQALANTERLLRGWGATLDHVVKATVFLTDMEDYAAVNEAYVAAFSNHRPARSVVAVAGLPLGAAVEVECWAFLGG